MSRQPLSPMQANVLVWVAMRTRVTGRMPSMQQIGSAFDRHSRRAWAICDALVTKGWMRKNEKRFEVIEPLEYVVIEPPSGLELEGRQPRQERCRPLLQ